jgi:hypothetical protein
MKNVMRVTAARADIGKTTYATMTQLMRQIAATSLKTIIFLKELLQ